MVVIRLARGGVRKRPFYHMVVTDSRKPRDSGYIERIGYFNPMARGKDVRFFIEADRYDYWLGQGAQPSDRVASLVKKEAKKAAKEAAEEADKQVD